MKCIRCEDKEVSRVIARPDGSQIRPLCEECFGEEMSQTTAFRELRPEAIESWATVLDCIEAGLEGQPEKCRSYAELLLERLEEAGEQTVTRHLRRVLAGEKGAQLFPTGAELEGVLRLTQLDGGQYVLHLEGQPPLVENQPLDLWVDYQGRFVAGRVCTKERGNQVFSATRGEPVRPGYWRLLRPGMRVRLKSDARPVAPGTERREGETW
jgi:hypothetical protein